MKTAIVSKNANKQLIEYLRSKGIEAIEFDSLEKVADPVKNHPDMLYCMLKDDVLFKGDPLKLSAEYPKDIIYNGCSTGKYFIHNLKYTDQKLLSEVNRLGLRTVNVSQGYAKCSIVTVDEDSIITYDKGIAEACIRAGMDVLTVTQGFVRLEGYNTGFIGGASGKADNEIFFNGNLEAHPDFDRIAGFIKGKGLSLKYFKEYELNDIGTVIVTNCIK